MGLDLILNCGSDKLIELKRLGYGPKKEENGSIPFVQQGFEASGKLDTGSLMGLDLAELEADINTFDGEEQYNFSLELNVFDLFETAAELNLKRLNNGRLAPNDLYFRLAVAGASPSCRLCLRRSSRAAAADSTGWPTPSTATLSPSRPSG